MADLLAGSVVAANDTPPTVSDRSDVAILAFSNTTYAAGSPAVGVSFTASTTGRAIVSWSGYLVAGGATAFSWLSFRLGTGSTVGSGTQVLAADDSRAIVVSQSSIRGRLGASELVTGLTPGAAYNVQLQHRRDNSNGDVNWRNIIVAPAT